MKFKLSQKWLVVLLTVIIPAILMVLAMMLESGICVFLTLVLWIGVAVIFAFIPYYKEQPDQ